jgi:hypothetical protein
METAVITRTARPLTDAELRRLRLTKVRWGAATRRMTATAGPLTTRTVARHLTAGDYTTR